MNAATFVLDLATDELALSEAARRLFDALGWTPATSSELVAHTFAEGREGLERALAEARRGREIDHEVHVEAHEPRGRWLLVRGDTPDPARKLEGLFVDVTRLRETELALARRNEELALRLAERTRTLTNAARALVVEMRRREEAQASLVHAQKLEALGLLTSGIAHDFNNLLQPIMTAFEILEERAEGARLRAPIANGRLAAHRAVGLVASLLSLSRKNDPAVLRMTPSEVLGEVGHLIRHTLRSRVQLVLDVAPDVWPVRVERTRLEAALLNLAVNARDAMHGRGTLRISVTNVPFGAPKPASLPAGEYVMIAVRDTGTGMTDEVLVRATEPFFTTKGPERGTGLGLAMVKAFATSSGGALRLQNAEGGGLEVEIYLPRSQAATLRALEPDPLGTRRTGVVLCAIADDVVLRASSTELRALGYEVLETPSAEVARALAHAVATLDLALIDLAPAEGAELVAHLRTERPSLPLLVARAPTIAARDRLELPYQPEELGALVDARLARRRSSEEHAARSVEHVRARVRSLSLRALCDVWLEARGDAVLPRPEALDASLSEHAERMFVALVERDRDPVTMRVLSIGRALSDRLGYAPIGDAWATGADEALGSVERAYRQAVRSRAPSYEYARFGTGEATAPVFERLLLPASDEGDDPTHVFGVVLMTDVPRRIPLSNAPLFRV